MSALQLQLIGKIEEASDDHRMILTNGTGQDYM